MLKTIAGIAGGSALAATSDGARAQADRPDERLSEAWWAAAQNEPEGAPLPTVLLVSDESAFDRLSEFDFDDVRTTTETDTPAAYAEIPNTVESIRPLLGLDALESVLYAPGANPFWVLEHYPDRVFPAVGDAVDYVSFPEFEQGIERLADQHPKLVNHERVGQSPGWLNVRSRELQRSDVHVVELSENVTDREAFAEKDKDVFALSIHGDERSGAEAGLRLIEDVLTGEADGLRDALGDRALVFLFPNPDGWISRSPFTVDGRFGATSLSLPGNTFKRTTGTGHDPNRIYPTTGWIDPTHRPAEPDGRDQTDDESGIDGDVPSEPYDYEIQVPDGLAIAEHLRGYENVAWFADLHGMFASEEFVKLLTMNHAFPFADAHAAFDLAGAVETNVGDAVGDLLDERRDVMEGKAEEMAEFYGLEETPAVPSEPFAAGTILDMVDYNTTGGLASWASRPPEEGGLGAVGLALEMAFDNRVGDGMTFEPDLVDMQVRAYQTAIQTVATHDATTDAAIEAGEGGDVALVTDDASVDAADLPFPTVKAGEARDVTETGGSNRDVTETPVTVPAGETGSAGVEVGEEVHRLGVAVDAAEGATDVELRNPSGELVRTSERHEMATAPRQRVSFAVTDPEPGKWSVDLPNQYGEREASVTVLATVVTGEGPPDPRTALGYGQRDYEASVTEVVDDYGAALQGASVRTVSPSDLADGGLDGVDAAVVRTDDLGDQSRAVAALREFASGGGSLVLTDAGVRLLGQSLFPGDVGKDDIRETGGQGFALGQRADDHPLLAGTRPEQRELARAGLLGYASAPGEITTYGVAPSAFEDAGGSVAGETLAPEEGGGAVTAGTIPLGDGEVTIVGGLLPAPTQRNLHPFGLEGAALTRFGYAVLANAVGHDAPAVPFESTDDGDESGESGSEDGESEDGESGKESEEGEDDESSEDEEDGDGEDDENSDDENDDESA